ncbi:MAG TPA: trehalase family glycosidase [Bacteroidota bacterium]|nr:trehalase family glycosidase [Bacteroidota bacterium]
MKKPDPIQFLTRTDKWYLGGGNRLLWAPPFPVFLDSPGFWDKAHYYNYELQPLFTWTLIDDDGAVIPLAMEKRSWNPACLTQTYKGRNEGMSVQVTEQKFVLPSDVAASAVTIRNKLSKSRRIHFLAWTAQESIPSKNQSWLTDISYDTSSLSFSRHLKPDGRPEVEVGCAWGLSRTATSYAVHLSEGSSALPRWDHTPFYEMFRKSRLPDEIKTSGLSNDGQLYLALHAIITMKPSSEQSVTVGLAAAPSTREAKQHLRAVLKQKDPVRLSRMSWSDHFDGVPSFQCSDEFLSRYYWYRWYGLRLNTLYGGEGNYEYPAVCEGIGYFRAPISYSAQCHMVENRWMHDPELAQGSLLTFIQNQREDGGFRGYIDLSYYRQEMFYHANWGRALQELLRIHPSLEYLQMVYDGLKKYASYFDHERDEEVSGLYDIDNHYETGQEFMHRYTAVDPNADRDNWGEVFRMKGVDVTVYIYELKRALARAAEILGKPEDTELWTIEADKIRNAVLAKMWDPNEEMFFDINPKTAERTRVKAATCFYPYFTDIVDTSHLPGLKKHLLNAAEFWTRFPVPSTSADDETFSATPDWKGKRMNCPWNGRVWPMTNSHIAEALAASAIRFNDTLLRKKTAEFISRFIRMMFFDGDPKRPNCFEHYNPFSGEPSVYRGIDDYQHSWVNDLIIKYVCGIRPEEFCVTIDPFPFGLKRATIDRVRVRGHWLKVEMLGKHFRVWLDQKMHTESTIGKSFSLQI